MSGEIKIKVPVKFDTINSNDLCELIWWSAHLGVGPEKLLSAIDHIGNSVQEVRKYIGLINADCNRKVV
ncbi:DUF3606 domain-containing protein [Ferruginibacter paludis]|uniref:DUF3606 domain-containing protein n=1 Tax=Ferruginibacter paludis TaxID=1310417 RepID=UPI00338DD0B7